MNDPDEEVPTDFVPSEETTHVPNELIRNLYDEINYDKKLYDQIHGTLTACPDFNNQNEYVVKNDGTTRTALDSPALTRARIKLMLEQHEQLTWWKDDVTKSPDGDIFCVEHFIALAVVMHGITNWSLVSSDDADDFTACKFDEEDDILHIGQMIADLWERVDRSLSRDAYSRLGVNGPERGSATNKIVGVIVGSSRMVISGLL